MIDSFMGKYRFLSNFHLCFVQLDGVWYPSTENAYQAAKTDPDLRHDFVTTEEWVDGKLNTRPTTPKEAKRLGQKVKLRPDWDSVKLQVMEDLTRQKFSDPTLKSMLLETGEHELVEGNYWHDCYWGSCTCVKCGSRTKYNNLGRILMKVRNELNERPSGTL